MLDGALLGVDEMTRFRQPVIWLLVIVRDLEIFECREASYEQYVKGGQRQCTEAVGLLYQERYPNKSVPNRRTFQRLNGPIVETRSFMVDRHCTGQTMRVRTVNLIQVIPYEVKNGPERSTSL